jgi:predicted ArsR family transcriptional regulator
MRGVSATSQGRETAGRAGASRLRILQALRSAPAVLGVADLAEQVGLHANTVRFHLDRLVAEGLALRHVEERSEPGRPRLVFTAAPVPDEQRDSRSYRLLAEILAGFVAGTAPEPAAAATEAGRAWGRYLTERPAPYRRSSEESAQRELLRLLAEIGFGAELAPDGSRVLLRHCPFLEVAQAHREVVCSVHLGLMQGALAEMRAPFTAKRLEPFVEPSLCVASLARAASG